MARYDQGWGPQGNRYDSQFRPGGGRGGRTDSRGNWGYGGEVLGREMGGWGESAMAPGGSDAEYGIYGPARYGLGPYHERLRNRKRPDGELREEVVEALFYDTWVDADAITVEVQDGIVTLRGELPNYEEVRYATDDAWDVDGVRGVRSELTVRDDEA